MNVVWWIIPAISGVVGLLLVFAGFGKFARFHLFSGGARALFGVGFLGLAGVVSFAGLNLQTYKRLTYESPVATLTFHAVPDAVDTYRIELLLPEDERYFCDGLDGPADCVVSGDEFAMGARVITFKPLANMLGYDAVYKLDYLEARKAQRFRARAVSSAESNGVALSDNPGFDVGMLAREQGGRFGVRDANFGSAVYNPIGDGLSYEVSITRTGLIARPANIETRRALGDLIGETALSKSESKTTPEIEKD